MNPKTLFLMACCSLGGLVLAEAAPRPNVLLICVDDLKPLLGCYGDKTVKSPSIDRLASQGVVFERAYCNQAVCAPSRNALMTGLRPTSLGIYDLGTFFRKAVPDAVSLSQQFMKNGYRAEAMGKIFHVGHGNHNDVDSWSVPHWHRGATYALKTNMQAQAREDALSSNPSSTAASRMPRGAAVECADVPDSTYADGQIADEAIKRLRAVKELPGQPFFIAVGFIKPHLPFVAPKKYWDLYQRSQFEPHKRQTPPQGAPEFAPTTWGELRHYSDIPDTGPLDVSMQRQLIHGYHAAVSYMDAQLGRVLDELDRLDLAKNTIVVLWGDHGWHLGDHGMWCKHTNYEQATRIPLIVSAPGIAKSGGRALALVETVDIYPSLCELAGLPVPTGLEGTSFVAALKDPAGAVSKQAVFQVYPRSPRGIGELLGRAVRTERYRLVEWKKPAADPTTAILELYDYQEDPEETKNLALAKSEVVAALRAILAKQPEGKPQIKSVATATAPTQDRAAMFARRDKDKNGKLTREEFLVGQPDPEEAPRRFPRFDTNGDGVLSREEFISAGKAPIKPAQAR
jgi:iduronate 2-sulfatase